ncbi:ComEA family DNA-binding protein [Gorillibacterium sp. sgz5001074]|uniref:ComEA family DNA-binding protein n=1 Tax=Gorillibacterium sp. sgz5001074 TaxID=3446695 RepID=UPI003F67A87C
MERWRWLRQAAVLAAVLLLLGAAWWGMRVVKEREPSADWIPVNREVEALLKEAEGEEDGSPAVMPSAGPSAGKLSAGAPAGKGRTEADSGLIDLNHAAVSRLEDLPGIGPGKAKAIAEYREQNGPFQQPEELMKVKGIGPKTYEALKDRISVMP